MVKKILLFSLTILLLVSLVSAFDGYCNLGTCYVTNCSELQSIKDDCDALNCSGTYVLNNSIDCGASGENYKQTGLGFQPIGFNNTLAFTGIFQGQNNTINGIYINRSTQDLVGVFGVAYNAYMYDVKVTNVNITGNLQVGGFIGTSSAVAGGARDRLVNIHTSGYVEGNDLYVGGVAGYIARSHIVNSSSNASIFGASSNVGGVAGYAYQSYIKNSFSSGYVNGGGAVGGIIGQLTATSSVYYSYSNSTVIGTALVGGVVGYSQGGTITGVYSTGDIISSGDQVGGVIGNLRYATFSDSYSTSSVTGVDRVGGLVGVSGQPITNSYSTGLVTGTGASVGGLVGYTTKAITNSSWDVCRSGINYCIGYNSSTLEYHINGSGCTGVNSNTSANDNYFYQLENIPMVNWDYATTWDNSCNQTGLPDLQWENDADCDTLGSCTGIVPEEEQIPETTNNAIQLLLVLLVGIIIGSIFLKKK